MTNARELAGLVGGTLLNVTTGTDNLAVGKDAGTAITTGDNNTFIGYASGDALTTSSDNTAAGKNSMSALTTGGSNTAVGLSALSDDTQGSKSTGVGYQALSSQNFTSATDSNNTAVGYNAGSLISTGTNNTLVGSRAGDAITSGLGNVGIGDEALSTETQGQRSVGIGVGALLNQNTTSATDVFNTAVGHAAGNQITSGTNNTLFGRQAGVAVTTGSTNTYIGPGTMGTATTGSNNTVIGGFNGNQGDLDIRTASNNIVLSDGAGNVKIRTDINSSVRFGPRFDTISGSVGGAAFITEANNRKTLYLACTTTSAQPLVYFFNSNGAVGYIQTSGSATTYSTSSDYRLKENVDYTWDATTRLKQLKPARFNFIADADTTVDGFLAHEAATVVPEAVTGEKDAMKDEEYEVKAAVTDDDGNVVEEAVMGTRSVPDMQGIDQSKLVPLLVKTIQELEARITVLEG